MKDGWGGRGGKKDGQDGEGLKCSPIFSPWCITSMSPNLDMSTSIDRRLLDDGEVTRNINWSRSWLCEMCKVGVVLELPSRLSNTLLSFSDVRS